LLFFEGRKSSWLILCSSSAGAWKIWNTPNLWMRY
jgi:hypothetical protein